jgi:hypothetical protein
MCDGSIADDFNFTDCHRAHVSRARHPCYFVRKHRQRGSSSTYTDNDEFNMLMCFDTGMLEDRNLTSRGPTLLMQVGVLVEIMAFSACLLLGARVMV